MASAANATPGVPSLTAGVSGAEYGSGIGAAEGGGILAGTASYAGPIAAGAVGGTFGHMAADKWSPIGGPREKAVGGGIAGGAAAGAAVGSIVPGVGTAIGAIVGGVVGGVTGLIEDGTVICTELLRQKKITDRERQKCVVFRFRHIPNDMFVAYLEWAAPIVAVMKRGGVLNSILLVFCIAFVDYMIAVQDRRKPTLLQRVVWKYAWWRCSAIVHKHCAEYVREVA